jgi:divalent metal cation (Fe/Co/Zn/Cd) transporter
LVERSAKEIAHIVKRKVEAIKDVRDCQVINLRMTGKRFYVEMHVVLDSNPGLEETHKIALNIEREVKSVVPGTRVTIHTEPLGSGRDVWKRIKEIAENMPGSRGVHNIHIQNIDGKLCVDLHLEVSANMAVKEAHEISNKIEKKIKAADSNISEITIHIESASDNISRELTGVERELKSYIEHVAKHFPEIKLVHGIRIRRMGDSLHVVLRCHFDSSMNVEKAHEISSRLEKTIRDTYPNIARVDIHEEPA